MLQLSLQRLKRLLAYLLLVTFVTVLVPRELWHHCEAHLHECEAEGTHFDDIAHHLSCDVCDFKLSSSGALKVFVLQAVRSSASELFLAIVEAVFPADATGISVRGPPVC